MNRVSVSITNFGIRWDDCFVASSIPKALQEQIDEAEATLEVKAEIMRGIWQKETN